MASRHASADPSCREPQWQPTLISGQPCSRCHYVDLKPIGMIVCRHVNDKFMWLHKNIRDAQGRKKDDPVRPSGCAAAALPGSCERCNLVKSSEVSLHSDFLQDFDPRTIQVKPEVYSKMSGAEAGCGADFSFGTLRWGRFAFQGQRDNLRFASSEAVLQTRCCRFTAPVRRSRRAQWHPF